MGSIVSAITGSGAKKAASAQVASSEAAIGTQKQSLAEQIKLMRESLDLQRQMYSDAQRYTAPYREAGTTAMANYESMLYGIPVEQTASYQIASQPVAKVTPTADRENMMVMAAKQFLPSTAVLSNASHRIGTASGGQNYIDPSTGIRYMVDVSNGTILQKSPNGQVSTVSGSEGLKGAVDAQISSIPAEQSPVLGVEQPGSVYDWQKTPGYEFRMDEGQKALERSASARSGLLSGAALKASQKFGQDYGTAEFDNALRRLGGLIDTGVNVASGSANTAIQSGQIQGGVLGNMASAQQNYGSNVSALRTNIGAAQASGYLGQQAAGTNLINQAAGIAGTF